MKTLNKQSVKHVRQDIEAALRAVGEKHGMEISIGNTRFDDYSLYTKITARVEGALTPQAEAYDELHDFYKLPPRGTRFADADGKTYTITGLNTRASKNKVIIVNDRGEEYRASVEYIEKAMERSAAARQLQSV